MINEIEEDVEPEIGDEEDADEEDHEVEDEPVEEHGHEVEDEPVEERDQEPDDSLVVEAHTKSAGTHQWQARCHTWKRGNDPEMAKLDAEDLHTEPDPGMARFLQRLSKARATARKRPVEFKGPPLEADPASCYKPWVPRCAAR